MMDIRKNKILAKLSQFVRKTNTKIYQRTRNVVRGIYYSRFLVFFRPAFDRIRRLFRPIYRFLKPKVLRKKLHIYYALILSLFFGIVLGIFYFDLQKDYGYDPIESADYSQIDWKEKIDNNGYSYFRSRDFKWKTVISPPNKSFLFKPSKDIAEVRMHIKDLRGSIQVPANVTIIDAEGNSSRSKRITSIANQKEVTLIAKAHFTSLLGLSFISPYQGQTIDVGGHPFNTATIQLPQNTKAIKFGDNNFANSYQVDEKNFFFHSFTNPAVVYYHYGFHTAIQIIIFILVIGCFIVFLKFKEIKIPRIKFKYKDFAITGIFIFIAMVFLALIIPNPDKLILNYDETNTSIGKEKDVRIYRPGQLPRYLRWALLLNQSFDGAVIGKINDCSLNDFRFNRYGFKKFIIIDTYKNNSCAQKALNYFPEKTVIVDGNSVMDEIRDIKSRDYRYNDRLFKYNAKLIFLLANLLLTVVCALLIWIVFSIKRLLDIILFIVTAFSSYFILIGIYLVVGAIAHMPIGYNGYTDTGLIMSNYE
jgi:hypothetical protein